MDNGSKISSRKEMINLYLDQAMNEEQRKEFILKVQSDPKLSAELEQEQQFRNMIKTSLNRPLSDPDFVNDIRNMIH